MFVRGCSVECWLWDSHLGFHWCCGMRCLFCFLAFGWWFREALVVWICWDSVICSFVI
jgi:hypothetical protein